MTECAQNCLLALKSSVFKLICFLGNIGGMHAKGCIQRILKQLMTTLLALQFNMLGMKGKQSFSALKDVKAVVFGIFFG